ncbi:unnamed protein product, partial [Mesorhabditis spiculigera]
MLFSTSFLLFAFPALAVGCKTANHSAPCDQCPNPSQTPPSPLTLVQGYFYFTTEDGCSKAENGCPVGGNLRLETDQGVITIPPPASESQELKCTSGNYRTVYEGVSYIVTGNICYTTACAACPTPNVAAGITVKTRYEEKFYCKRAQFSGCANGYK